MGGCAAVASPPEHSNLSTRVVTAGLPSLPGPDKYSIYSLGLSQTLLTGKAILSDVS